MKDTACSVLGCVRTVRSARATMCERHYYRLRRTGTTDPRPTVSGVCRIDGCTAKATCAGTSGVPTSSGVCRKHHLRIQRRDDPHFELRGAAVKAWTGDAATSGGVHQRIKKLRGSARHWCCSDCSCPAAHWSYDHSDPDEKIDPVRGPYSLDLDRYQPRCVRCHKRFDMDFLSRAGVAR